MTTNLIVCGLGNPGPEYDGTRHNLGFRVADLLGERYSGKWRRPLGPYLECRIEIAGSAVTLVEPLTYMNRSGRVVRALTERGELEPDRLLVVCDDTALPLGRLRLRRKGSDGGHNGLASVIEALGRQDFDRLRLGVGPVPEGTDWADFVLSPFPAGERKAAEAMTARAADCVVAWVSEGAEAAMSRYNERGTPTEESD